MPVLDQWWNAALALYARFGSLASDFPIVGSLFGGVRALAMVFVVVFVLEWLTGGNLRRYRTRNFRTDMTYGIFYYGGIYNALIYVPVVTGLAMIAPDWNFRLMDHVPGPAGFVIYWLLADAAGYWIHRWYHSNSLLWTFHKVHHTQTELTFVTSFRNHAVEQLVSNVVLFVPLMVLGGPLWYWGPAYFIQNIFEGLQHSDIKWRYGRLYPVLVSPVFHAIHHSPDRVRHDSNYGKILSVWDYLFGTMTVGERPERYGLADVEMPVTFIGTMAAPFVELWQRVRNFADRPDKRPA
jgi:sterol desaturase/sphingolipid hydroxylase (fatty acid hydroxylase superfamily)